MDVNHLWALEHSQYSEDKGMYPWHIGRLKEAINGNFRDCRYNNRENNKWQIIFVGLTFESCADVLDQLYKLKQWDAKKDIKLPDKSGYVYLIKATTGQYKIGRTRNIPNRMRLFSVKLPFEFEIIHTLPCFDTVEAERQLHIIFRDKRINGEWFNLSDSDIEIIKTIHCSNIHKEFEKIDKNGDTWGMPELWEFLPEGYEIR